uniref:Uncharacterized protein n=1 Tax=Vitis vinifera TaxID=29760 RepID=F6HSH4_VITVI
MAMEKVRIVSIHSEGKALEWFQGYETSVKELNWNTFTADVIV